MGLDEHAQKACVHHATYLWDLDARPVEGEAPIRSWARALVAANDAFAAFPELRGE
ncbi:MAG TPA: hypothetical protein VFO85_08920 [Vicinamibacteria bacterium]|nr:hypothetical protein [Vicinamibacteria bacterium]